MSGKLLFIFGLLRRYRLIDKPLYSVIDRIAKSHGKAYEILHLAGDRTPREVISKTFYVCTTLST